VQDPVTRDFVTSAVIITSTVITDADVPPPSHRANMPAKLMRDMAGQYP
jgi:hypothetical protein